MFALLLIYTLVKILDFVIMSVAILYLLNTSLIPCVETYNMVIL